jgi:hypothetical protein
VKHNIVSKFSQEVDKQINQFGIDLIEDVSNEIDREMDAKQGILGLNRQQTDAFGAVLQAARQKVLAKYGLETKDTRTDTPYPGEKYPGKFKERDPQGS